jgi:hypothetical protein
LDLPPFPIRDEVFLGRNHVNGSICRFFANVEIVNRLSAMEENREEVDAKHTQLSIYRRWHLALCGLHTLVFCQHFFSRHFLCDAAQKWGQLDPILYPKVLQDIAYSYSSPKKKRNYLILKNLYFQILSKKVFGNNFPYEDGLFPNTF